jgi:mono/diheme cytochrome c family protein
MLAGWDVFTKKGCGTCHAIRGRGGTVGPDLGRIQTGTSFFGVGAALWNHLPRMGARMRQERIERPRLTPREMSNLIAFIFTAQYSDERGDPKAGQRLFTATCMQCHALGGTGGQGAPALDALKGAKSPALLAAAMWNHGPAAAEAMKARGIAYPVFRGNELLDVVAYIGSVARDVAAETPVVPGTPERGRQLFAEKQCVTCHAVGGAGGRIGPDLGGPGHHISLMQFASRMWNHQPAMVAKLKERRAEVPTLTGQDMADILAHLYASRYFEPRPDVKRGQRLVEAKGCLTCHAVSGKGGETAVDFAASAAVRNPADLVAGMWNHGLAMEAQARDHGTSWPELTGHELGDIAAYLMSRVPAGKPAVK